MAMIATRLHSAGTFCRTLGAGEFDKRRGSSIEVSITLNNCFIINQDFYYDLLWPRA